MEEKSLVLGLVIQTYSKELNAVSQSDKRRKKGRVREMIL